MHFLRSSLDNKYFYLKTKNYLVNMFNKKKIIKISNL